MGRTACTEPQCLYSRAIPLLPLWAVRPVQSLSACTVELYLYPPMGRTACTEPQCLYKGALYLFLYIKWIQRLTWRTALIRDGSTRRLIAANVAAFCNMATIRRFGENCWFFGLYTGQNGVTVVKNQQSWHTRPLKVKISLSTPWRHIQGVEA